MTKQKQFLMVISNIITGNIERKFNFACYFQWQIFNYKEIVEVTSVDDVDKFVVW